MQVNRTHFEHHGGLDRAGAGGGSVPPAQGQFEEGLGDSRREEQFCREQRHSRELTVSLLNTKMEGQGPVLHSLRSFS